ncbi:MAG: hypothetical protein NT105_11215 [Verrucomicrobia bacterium]|nr:hypothetical protein [Verrucomicrobiota bacterium]
MSRKKPAPPKVRRLWNIKPVERIKPSVKVYSRKKLQTPSADNGVC